MPFPHKVDIFIKGIFHFIGADYRAAVCKPVYNWLADRYWIEGVDWFEYKRGDYLASDNITLVTAFGFACEDKALEFKLKFG